MRQRFARVVVRNEEGKFLVIHTTKAGRNRWEFPGGKVEDREMPMVGALRELFEEVGIVLLTKVLLVGEVDITIDGHDWHGWFYEAQRHNYIASNREKDKVDEIRWVTFEELSELPQIPKLCQDIAFIVVHTESLRNQDRQLQIEHIAERHNLGTMTPEGDGWGWDFQPDEIAIKALNAAYELGAKQ